MIEQKKNRSHTGHPICEPADSHTGHPICEPAEWGRELAKVYEPDRPVCEPAKFVNGLEHIRSWQQITKTLFLATTDPQVTVKLWLPQPPSSPFEPVM